ncbi:hypothetical protein DGG96_16985 [Legionella qingyii]|uniref:Antitoxin SocA-like Panacea domain-containing protein n=1 Tax=Legionella qingyii TaxID=2184757 RepID=A0A317TXZ3_9GAMM|nr:hypothetical protein [Legionella qingyii]PWY54119.1 hypothetical protein DGG96_18605 [Legionella qingyii]PWY54463.1 hypothetical protein DGG96_16985 [Legionella qingyii]RUR21105.1 hypothetical protein ELY20_13410 [Legionella qingyii]
MNNEQLILGILEEAHNCGISPLLKTSLIKYLYLLEVYLAEECQGKTTPNWEWKFLHYGPFSTNVMKDIDTLETKKKIITIPSTSQENGKDCVLYKITDYQRTENLADLKVSVSVQSRIQADMKRYQQNLTKLLDYVYFKTNPMRNARPGDILNFTNCIKKNPNDYRVIQMKKISSKAIKEARNKLRILIDIRTQKSIIAHGSYDQVYYEGLNMLDEEPLDTGLEGQATLSD